VVFEHGINDVEVASSMGHNPRFSRNCGAERARQIVVEPVELELNFG
jgi:hypothetical protein